MKIRRSRFHGRKLRLRVKLLIAVGLLGISLLLFNRAVDNLFARITEDQVHNLGTEMLNQAVNTLLEDESIRQDELLEIHYQEDESISSITIDSDQVNRIRTRLNEFVLKSLHEQETETIQIPLGSLTNFWFLSAKGPDITFHVYPVGYLNSRIRSEFDGAGINQTRHRLVLELELELMCVGLLHRETVTVSSEYILSETLLMGETPEQYGQILFEDRQKIE